MSDTVEGLGKVKCVHNKIVIGLKEGGDGVEEMNKSYCGGCSRLKGKLVQETEVRWRRLKGWVNIVGDNNEFQQSGENWGDGDGSVVGGRERTGVMEMGL